MIDLVKNYSTLGRRLKKSVIRDLLALTNKPGLISFAGGLPMASCFPVEDIKDIVNTVLEREPESALQYGQTEGYLPLRSLIVDWMNEHGYSVNIDNILVTVASQQGIDLTMKLFVDPSDPVFVEMPSYPGGLQSLASCGAHFYGVHSDNDGLIVDALEKKLQDMVKEGEHYKLIYIVPDFQNPSGVTLSYERRKRLVELSHIYNLLIVEDTPYRDLRFEGDTPPSLFQLAEPGNIIALHTFSKIFVPGFRIGWVVAHPDIIKKLAVAKQSTDLCTPNFTQSIAAEFMRRGLLAPYIAKVTDIYRKKRDAMLTALGEYMPEGVSWTRPEGGLFLWVTMPESIDSETMFYEAVEHQVAYVVGSAFHFDGSGKNNMRLNFSFPSEEEIHTGIQSLAEVIKRNLVGKQLCVKSNVK